MRSVNAVDQFVNGRNRRVDGVAGTRGLILADRFNRNPPLSSFYSRHVMTKFGWENCEKKSLD